jgi:hypothetical protein
MKSLVGLLSAVALSATPALAQSDEPAADQDAVEDAAGDAAEDALQADEAAAREDDLFADVTRESYARDHVWVGDSVEIDEEKVGEISHVYYDENGLIDAIVVDAGDREVEVDILQSHVRSDTEEVVIFWLDLDKEQFDALPAFDMADAAAANEAPEQDADEAAD